MKKLLNIVLIAIAFSQIARAQVDIETVSKISITDQININYEKVNSYIFEIRFNDSIELWNTKQLTRAEFQQSIFKQQTDSINSDLFVKRKEIGNRDSLKLLFEKKKEFLENAYLIYCDTVKSEFIKYLLESAIVELLKGVQDSVYNEEMFKNQHKLDDETSYGNSIIMTSYYPLLGMTIYSSTGDTLVVYNDGQQDLMIPWKSKSMNIELWNPLINLSLDAILPDERNYNKKRLTKGIKK